MPDVDREPAAKKSFGPMTPEAFADAVNAPYGTAKRLIQRIDPLWGRAEGEKFEWKVTADCMTRGVAYVTASSQEEADKLADQLSFNDFEWGDGFSDNFDILWVQPSSK
jgi:hypothetical protein